MPTVTLNRKVLEKLLGKKLTVNQLKDRISMLGTDLEKIEGDEIVVEVFPNRPDMLSEQGFARALSSFIGVKTGFKKYEVVSSKKKLIIKNSLAEWPNAIACCITGLKLNNEKIREIIQLQEKLGMTYTRNRKKGGLGLYPLHKIAFPITFTCKKPEDIKFRPLEYPNELNAKQILSKHTKGREYGSIMETWSKYPVFIDAKNKIMSMPPIINSHDVGKIDESTTDVFIEGTGPDLNILLTSLTILATSLSDMGGKILSLEIVDSKKNFIFPDLKPRKMNIDLKYINKIIGMKFTEKEVKNLLERMGYGYENKTVLIPKYRADILHQIDLAEDIAIAYGYENFIPKIPNVSTIGEENKIELFKKTVANILVGLGLIETISHHLTNKDEQTKKMEIEIDLVELEKASSKEFDVLRSWITPSLISILSNNTNREYPQAIFEIGKVFKKNNKTETGIKEDWRIAVALADSDADFTRIKQLFDVLMTALDLKYDSRQIDHDSFIPGRVARIAVNGKKVAYIGEIHPKVITNFGIEMPICTFELNLSELIEVL